MLAQDRYGYVHDIPDAHLQDARTVYDGLGNPVGQLGDFFDFLKPVAQVVSQALPAVGAALTAPLQMATAPLQAVSGLVSNLLPHPSAPPPPSPMPMPMPAMPAPAPAPYPFPFRPPFMLPPGMPQPPMVQHHPHPLGWIHPNLPYTGLGPQRLYMRCAVWPGPAGLVPGPQMPTGPWPGPGGPGAPGGGFPGGGFHHGRHSRHRRR